MLLDRAFRLALRNFSTLFGITAVVTVTLHLIHAVVFRDVIAISDLHIELENIGRAIRLQGVSPDDLDAFRTFYLVLVGLELASLPVLVGAANRALDVDETNGVPTIIDSYRNLRLGRGRLSFHLDRRGWTTVLISAVVAVVVGFLFARAGLLLSEALPDRALFAGAGMVRGIAPALGAPFFLATLVAVAREARLRSPAP